MGRGRRRLLADLAVLPWPVGLAMSVAGYLLIRHGISAWLAGQSGPLAKGLVEGVPFAVFAWLALGLCANASLASFLDTRRKRQLLDTRTGLASIAALGWRDFERLVGEAFRRQGQTAGESGLGGSVLALRKGSKQILVQCNKWQREKVPVNVLREMYGLLAHHNADEVRIATIGG